MRYDLPRLLGKPLSDSEKVVTRKVIRELEADGLLWLDPPARPTAIMLSELGREAAA
jgi:hypothetical protein